MLVSTMSDGELSNELIEDSEFVISNINSLANEYHKKRKKNRIKNTSEFPVVFSRRSPNNNMWYFIINKDSYYQSYKRGRVAGTYFTHYESKYGFKAFKLIPTANGDFSGVVSISRHLLLRYNLRLNLGISKMIDLALHFFKNNPVSNFHFSNVDEKRVVNGVCNSGYLLGTSKIVEVGENLSIYWIVYRTFISDNEIKPEQVVYFKGINANLESKIYNALNEEEFDELKYQYLVSVLNSLRNSQ